MIVKDQSERLLQKHGLLCECKESQRLLETRVSVVNQVANHIFRGPLSHKVVKAEQHPPFMTLGLINMQNSAL